MINKRKGISLIVLVITIIVIIILAGAVILSLANNNPISQATEASFKSDVNSFNSELQLWISSQYVSNPGTFKPEDVNVDNLDNKYNGKNIGDIITSMKGDYLNKFKILSGKLVYADSSNTTESNWASQISIGKASNTVSGKNIYISDAQNSYGVINSINGFSTQNSSPTITSPSNVLSAGDNGNVKLLSHGKNFFNPLLLTNSTVTNDQVTFNITNQYDHLIFKGELGLEPSTQYNVNIVITENTATLPISFYTSSTTAFDTTFNINPGQTGTINQVITTKADFKNVLYDIWLWHPNTGTGYIKFKMHITKGASVQAYEPYNYAEYNIALPANFLLASIPSGVSDTIDSTGLCTKKIAKATLNGSEVWTLRTVGTNTLEFLCDSALPNRVDNGNTNIYNNRMPVLDGTSDVEHLRSSTDVNKNYIVLYINKSRLATQDVAGFKTWLANNNINVYYETSNVTTTKITLPTFKTYQGDTYVTTKNSVQPTLNVNYVK